MSNSPRWLNYTDVIEPHTKEERRFSYARQAPTDNCSIEGGRRRRLRVHCGCLPSSERLVANGDVSCLGQLTREPSPLSPCPPMNASTPGSQMGGPGRIRTEGPCTGIFQSHNRAPAATDRLRSPPQPTSDPGSLANPLSFESRRGPNARTPFGKGRLGRRTILTADKIFGAPARRDLNFSSTELTHSKGPYQLINTEENRFQAFRSGRHCERRSHVRHCGGVSLARG
jgi:hypothetical protein